MIRGTSAVLLPLNGPLSSGYTGTRAFLNPNIRGGQESHKSHSRSGWNTIRGQGLLPKEGLQPFPLSPEGVQGSSSGAVRDAKPKPAVVNMFYFTDFCVSLQPAHNFRSSEVSGPK